jgi:hypothetical protein
MDAVVAKALALGAHVLASEGLLWPTATQLALLSLVQFDAAWFELSLWPPSVWPWVPTQAEGAHFPGEGVPAHARWQLQFHPHNFDVRLLGYRFADMGLDCVAAATTKVGYLGR